MLKYSNLEIDVLSIGKDDSILIGVNFLPIILSVI